MNLGAILLNKISETQKDKQTVYDSTYIKSLEWSRSETEPRKADFPRLWGKMTTGPILLGPSPFISESLCPLPQMDWVSVALPIKAHQTPLKASKPYNFNASFQIKSVDPS